MKGPGWSLRIRFRFTSEFLLAVMFLALLALALTACELPKPLTPKQIFNPCPKGTTTTAATALGGAYRPLVFCSDGSAYFEGKPVAP